MEDSQGSAQPPPTAKATAAAARIAHEKRADWLAERGWLCVPPELRDHVMFALNENHPATHDELAKRGAAAG